MNQRLIKFSVELQTDKSFEIKLMTYIKSLVSLFVKYPEKVPVVVKCD